MDNPQTHSKKRFLVLTAVLTFSLSISLLHKILVTTPSDYAVTAVDDVCDGQCHSAAEGDHSLHARVASRLQRRLERAMGSNYSVSSLVAALEHREHLLNRVVTVNVANEDGTQRTSWTFSTAAYPGLLTLQQRWNGVHFVVDNDVLSNVLEHAHIQDMKRAVIPTATSIASDGFVQRATVSAIAHSGFAYNMQDLSESLTSALINGEPSINLTLPYEEAHIILRTAEGEMQLNLLAHGMSDFSNSPEERVWNVYKAFDERVNNVAVLAGEKFSFVATLGGPVTLDKGWREGMGLFGGGAALTPGAGICQAATTVFRAALLAGLPITEKRNHSMFVDHYEPYGVGLDATIFPGVHDLSFRNDTSAPIIIQSYTVGDFAYVNMFGVPDGRTVELEGPYFYATRPRPAELRPLAREEIGWVSRVTMPDGTVRVKPSIATYHKGFSKSVMTKYAGTPGISLLHAEPESTL